MKLSSCLPLITFFSFASVSCLAQQTKIPQPDLLVASALPSVPFSTTESALEVDQNAVIPKTNETVYPKPRVIFRSYLNDLIGPSAFIGAGIQAGVDQARPLKVGYPSDGYSVTGKHPAHGTVPEWGLGAEGYGKRYASRFGQGLIGTTTFYGLGFALQQDVTYHRCECTGVLARSAHAFTASFIAHTKSGRAVPSLPALASPFVASEVAVKAWYPQRYNTSDALRTSATLYVVFPLRNLVKEFSR